MNKKTVLITGAGPSGWAAAKECWEAGLKPYVLEQRNEIGGVWALNSGDTWASLKTNISRYTCGFSDFPWPSDANDFPTAGGLGHYLKDYADHYNIKRHITFGQVVEQINQNGNGFKVFWHDRNNKNKRNNAEFDFVVNAGGIFSKEKYPSINGLHTFKGNKLHSQNYKSARQNNLYGKNVAVIGSSFSGIEIAADLAKSGIPVTHFVNSTPFFVPRYKQTQHGNLPYDLLRTRGSKTESVSNRVDNKERQMGLLETYGNPGDIHPAFYVDPNRNDPVRVVITDDYPGLVKDKKINVINGGLNHISNGQDLISEKNAVVKNIDTIIFCTGYSSSINYLSNTIKDTINYNPYDVNYPALLYNATFHPDVPGMAFNGLYRGPYFPVMEMQARWAASVFAGETALPDQKTMHALMKRDKKRITSKPRPQFPYGDHIALCNAIAENVGCVPDTKMMNYKEKNIVECGPFTSAQYRMNGPGAKPDVAWDQIDAIMKRIGMKP